MEADKLLIATKCSYPGTVTICIDPVPEWNENHSTRAYTVGLVDNRHNSYNSYTFRLSDNLRDRPSETKIARICGEKKISAQIVEVFAHGTIEKSITVKNMNVALSSTANIIKTIHAFHSIKLPDPDFMTYTYPWDKWMHAVDETDLFDKHEKYTMMNKYRRMRSLPGKCVVLCHTKLWKGNIVSTNNGFKLMDWQDAQYGCARFDLAGFLFTDFFNGADNRIALQRFAVGEYARVSGLSITFQEVKDCAPLITFGRFIWHTYMAENTPHQKHVDDSRYFYDEFMAWSALPEK
jgi:thiamine kinase-like enzyme